MKKLLTVAGVAALLAGCYSVKNDYPPASGSSTAEDNVYTGASSDRYYHDSPLYRGRYGTLGPPAYATNWFGPVNSGVEAAMPPGTASGGTLRQAY